jgi:hypothetical protein
VLPGCIPERSVYREAHNRGLAVTEARRALDDRVDRLMEGLYLRVAGQLQSKERRRSARKRKAAS